MCFNVFGAWYKAYLNTLGDVRDKAHDVHSSQMLLCVCT